MDNAVEKEGSGRFLQLVFVRDAVAARVAFTLGCHVDAESGVVHAESLFSEVRPFGFELS
jgi:hypothetical protein